MEVCGNRISCRDLFRKFHILPLTSRHLLPLLMFVVQHKDLFITSMNSHNLETRQSNNLYTPQTNLSVYQKVAYYSGVKIFNGYLFFINSLFVIVLYVYCSSTHALPINLLLSNLGGFIL
jgi:hypothetical protein